jgi:hypothetical protein
MTTDPDHAIDADSPEGQAILREIRTPELDALRLDRPLRPWRLGASHRCLGGCGRDWRGFYWESAKLANNALRAEGWKPPKGWKPLNDDIVKCDGCGQPGRRRKGYPCPDHWFFLESRVAGEVIAGLLVLADIYAGSPDVNNGAKLVRELERYRR